ncbi:hypothetical protein [Glycomyces sp. L485]|uniref:hypothetical protein n=1 Tax=Glycomyces sp. L485 TaxID=2909235 RepID=UPI00321BABC2
MKLEELGRPAVRALFDAIDDERDRGVQTMPCRVAIRGSTAPLRSPAFPTDQGPTATWQSTTWSSTMPMACIIA